jgi:hypothetical protein
MAIEHSPAPIDRSRLRSQRLREVNFPILAERREQWSPRSSRHSRGILSLYEQVASSASHGASLVT